MRKLATFEDPDVARTVAEVLYAENIDSDVREGPDRTLSVWVLAEQDMPRAQSILDRFASLPDAREFARARERALRPKPAPEAARPSEAAPPPPVAQPKKSLGQRAKESPLTFALIAVSTVVSLATGFGDRRDLVSDLSIASHEIVGTYVRWDGWHDVLAGQVYRLITPIFLHFNFLHLAFNSVITYQLGGPTERFQGSLRYLGLVIWSAILSNAAQFAFGHTPTFGGLSGVVYALIGYLWARGYADPRSGIYLPGRFVVSFLVLMAVGFTGLLDGLLGRTANFCHLFGFIGGVSFGYIAGLLARLRRPM